jgi:hypothetical protein
MDSDLKRIEPDALRDGFGDTPIEIVQGDAWFTRSADHGSSELWWWVLVGLTGVLFTEQSLAGWISRRRR